METNNVNTIQDIKQTAIFNAPIQKVWDAVSSSEGIAAWFMPNDFQPVVGHEFYLQSPFGPSPCKVLEIEAPHRLSFSWDKDGWVVTFYLKEVGNQTEFTVVHGGWKQPGEIVPKAQEDASVIRDRMNHGWQSLVQDKLRKAVEG